MLLYMIHDFLYASNFYCVWYSSGSAYRYNGVHKSQLCLQLYQNCAFLMFNSCSLNHEIFFSSYFIMHRSFRCWFHCVTHTRVYGLVKLGESQIVYQTSPIQHTPHHNYNTFISTHIQNLGYLKYTIMGC